MTKPAAAVDKRTQKGGGAPPDWSKTPPPSKNVQRKFMWDDKLVLGIAYAYMKFGEKCPEWLRASDEERLAALNLLNKAKEEV